MKHVRKTGSCWLWIGSSSGNGYGGFKTSDGYKHLAHRKAFELFKGKIPKGRQVLHKCDVRRCVNPDHLYLGDHAQNMADRDARGRTAKGDRSGARVHPERRPHGERHGMAKTTEREVREIRAQYDRGMSRAAIARNVSISAATVGLIVRRITWKHVADETQQMVAQ